MAKKSKKNEVSEKEEKMELTYDKEKNQFVLRVIFSRKTRMGKFPGKVDTYCFKNINSLNMMMDGVAEAIAAE